MLKLTVQEIAILHPYCGEAKPRFSIDVLPLLTGELADKVVQCTGFTQEEPKVNDGSAEEAQA